MGTVTLEKKSDGKLYLNNKEVIRYLSSQQKTGSIEGRELRKELIDKEVLNACILDALLQNPSLIPEDWRKCFIYSWGTIFRGGGGRLYVECLYWGRDRWDWLCSWLDDPCFSEDAAALVG